MGIEFVDNVIASSVLPLDTSDFEDILEVKVWMDSFLDMLSSSSFPSMLDRIFGAADCSDIIDSLLAGFRLFVAPAQLVDCDLVIAEDSETDIAIPQPNFSWSVTEQTSLHFGHITTCIPFGDTVEKGSLVFPPGDGAPSSSFIDEGLLCGTCKSLPCL
jgi:hypothetical protein